MVAMAHHDDVRRLWFSDARDQGRQMELSWHPEERIVILSLWHGTVCRASFRLPVGEVPGVIEMLAASLGDVATDLRHEAAPDPPPAIPRRWRERTGRDPDTVVHMSEHA
jgi:hypothetical protein